jgi:hypothetical protein
MNERKNEANDDKKELKSIGLLHWRFQVKGLLMFLIFLGAATGIFAYQSSAAGWEGYSRLWNVCNILLLVTVLLISKKLSDKKYLNCPYCDHSVLIELDWQCDYCKKFQGKPKYICEPCSHCGKELSSAFCEHCHEEFMF